MPHVGRKIYINWGKNIIAIERFFEGQFYEQANLNKNDYPTGDLISIFDIFSYGNERVEKYVGKPSSTDKKIVGMSISDLFITGSCWIAKEENTGSFED